MLQMRELCFYYQCDEYNNLEPHKKTKERMQMKKYAHRVMHNSNLHPAHTKLIMHSSKLLKTLPMKRLIKNKL